MVGLPPECDVPDWAKQGRFFSVTQTEHELSIICAECYLPSELLDQPSWYLLGCKGPISFDSVGLIAKLTAILADSGLSTLTVATYHTDYLLTRDPDAARKALQNVGYEIIRANSSEMIS